MFIQSPWAHGSGSIVEIKPEHVVNSIMGMSRIIYEIIKIIQCIVIIILSFYFISYEIQQLISNIDSRMKCMTFHVQLLVLYHHAIMPCGMG